METIIDDNEKLRTNNYFLVYNLLNRENSIQKGEEIFVLLGKIK